MKKININLPQNGYDVFVGNNVFTQLIKKINLLKLNKNLFFVVDKNVYTLHSKKIDTTITSYKGKTNILVLEVNEKLKSFKTMEKIYQALLENNYTRDTLIIAIGGGIIGDICGFVAATYSRGIQYVQVPTTLLSTVDSSVGGKTGINFGKTKNIIGAFNQPNFVLIDVDFLQTLSQKELLSGIGEVIKYAYLTNSTFYKYIEKNIEKIFLKDSTVLKKIINESVRFKGDVVVSDEKEESNRKILNLGHTFAHAFEVETKYKLKHGEAVIVGIASAIFLSNKLNLMSNAKMDDLLKLILLFKNEIKIAKLDNNKLISVMQRDKKNRNGKIKFVLLKDIGNIILDVETNVTNIKYALDKGINIFR